jgi:hypothetical protein
MRVQPEAQGGHSPLEMPSEGPAGNAHGCRRLTFIKVGVVPQDEGLTLPARQLPQRGERPPARDGRAAATGLWQAVHPPGGVHDEAPQESHAAIGVSQPPPLQAHRGERFLHNLLSNARNHVGGH